MKKLICVALTLVLVFSFSSCGNTGTKEKVTQTEKKVSLPISGKFSFVGDIIVDGEKADVTGNTISNAQAYTYKDGEFYKLKKYETEITIPKKYTTYGEYAGCDITAKLQYFVCNSTVYAYLSENASKSFELEIISIPQNDECVIIQSLVVTPLYVNLKTGKIKPMLDYKKVSGQVQCVSDDGKYAAVFGGVIENFEQTAYLVDLKNLKAKSVPLWDYDKNTYKIDNAFPYSFGCGSEHLYIIATLKKIDNPNEEIKERYYYNTKRKEIATSKEDIAFDEYVKSEQYPYIATKFDKKTGLIYVMNFNGFTNYSFSHNSSYDFNGIGTPNKKGKYFMAEYGPQNFLFKLEEKTAIDYTMYDGHEIRYNWISEKELVVVKEGKQETLSEVIRIGE